MANLSITVIDGNNISVSVASRATQTVTIDRGISGAVGPQGVPGINWLGTWSGATTYAIRDAVTYNGTSYYAIASNTNQAPPNASYWNVLAQKGGDSALTSVGLVLPSFMAVTNSPITTSGNLTGTLTTQAVNAIFAGASSGTATAPTFRALVTSDIPSLSYVSSVGATAPITTTGGLTPTIGVTSAALNKTDDTNVTMTLSGAPTTALLAATTMALGWTGQLAVNRGGTGAALTTANFVFAGPTSGAPAAPTFRALTTADISSLGYVTSVSGTTGRTTSTGGTTPIIDLASGVIAAGTTGSITAIPVITVDTYGRITSITTAANPQGTVTSVTGTSPVVSSGGATPAINLATAYGDTLNPYASKTANTILAAPNGSAGVPIFRALTTADIPSLPYGTGTVTSVALTLPSIISVSGSPITTSGTIAGTLTTQSINSIFAGPSSGSASAPTFRSLTTADIPALSYVTSVAATVPSFLSISGSPITASGTLAISYSGTGLPIANGGTGQTTAGAAFNSLSPVTTTGDLIIGNGTNSATRLGIGTNGYVLTSNGTTASWSAATGGVTQIVAGTNVTISPTGGTGVVTINASGGASAYTRTSFTATAGQTAFTVTYAVGYLQVYVNGVLLATSDYTATSGTGFTLGVACAVGDIVEALVITTSVTGVTTGKSIAMAMIFGY